MDPLSIQFLGQAGLWIEYKKTRILCDPWFSETGGFLASWHQFPRNTFLDTSKLHSATHLYISHTHHDHFDREYLERYPNKDVEVMIANFLSQELEKGMRSMGFKNVRTYDSWEKFNVGDCNGTIILDPSGYSEDSSIILDFDNFRIYNQNDCLIDAKDEVKLSEIGIDVHFTQFSGAHYYPVTYQYSQQVLAQKITEFRRNLVQRFVKRMSTIKPRAVIPFAGPICFLEPESFDMNFGSIFPDMFEFKEMIANQINCQYMIMMPGDTVLLPSLELVSSDRQPSVASFASKKEYLEKYSRDRLPVIQRYLESIPDPADAEALKKDLQKHLQTIFGKNPYLVNHVKALVCFEVPGYFKLYVDFKPSVPAFSDATGATPDYTFIVPAKYLNLIVQGRLLWEELLLSLRLKIRRDPDVYNWFLLALLRFGFNEKLLKQVEKIDRESSAESIVVKSEGQEYEVQRFCPHAGEDLARAEVKGKVLTCSRHRWSFDLESGSCIAGGNRNLRTRKLSSDD